MPALDEGLRARIRKELEGTLGEDRVLWRKSDLLPYTTDANIQTIRLGDACRYFPDLVVLPGTTGEVQAVVKLTAKHKIPLLPKGGGSNRTGMLVPERGGIVLDTIKMNRVLEVSVPNLYVTVQPGITLKDLEERLEEHGLALNQEQGSFKVATVGGSISTAGFGRKHQKYGTISDRVMSLEVVLPDGRILRTGPKVLYTSTGYRLSQLFIGAEGTLGVITEATLRVEPVPEAKGLVMGFFDDFSHAFEAAGKVTGSGVTFAGAEVYELSDSMSLGAPEGKHGVFCVSLEGTKGEVEAETEFIRRIILESGGAIASDEAARQQFEKYTIQWCGLRAVVGFEDDFMPYIPAKRAEEFYDKVWNDIMPRYGISPSEDGKYGADIGRYRMLYGRFIIPDGEVGWENYRKAFREILELAINLGGSIAGCAGIGIKHTDDLPLEYSDAALDLMWRIKKALDPDDIMNPGKKLPKRKPAAGS
ncbi:MAG TPA: FAD-binding oxidoreductase [Thermoplasmata archaeon]